MSEKDDKNWLAKIDSLRGPTCSACCDPLNGRLKKLLKTIIEAKVNVPSTKIHERMCEIDPTYGARVGRDSLARHFRHGHEPLRKGNTAPLVGEVDAS